MKVYKVTNLINGKCYIGQTINSLARRWYGHYHPKSGAGRSALREAIIKYGKGSFKIEVIAECNSANSLDLVEKFFIHYYNTLAPAGYNLEAGGSRNNKIISNSTRLKMSLAKKGKKQSPELIAARSKGMKGRKQSQETKAKIGATNKGRKPWCTGIKRPPMSQEQKLKLSQSLKKYYENRQL